MTHTHAAPTEAQLQQAFAQMRAAGWPATLAELQLDTTPLATARLGIVLGAARRIALGGHPERPDLSGPIRAASPAPHHPPTRRRSDTGFDRKRLAAGDRDD